MNFLLVKKLSENATVPTKGSKHSAGYDLYSSTDIWIPAKSKKLIPTDISINLPESTYGRVAPRSGLAVKHFLDIGAGVIDRDYTGPIFVLVFNFSEFNYKVDKGDRIAQLIIEKIETPEIVEVLELSETLRNSNGFGSTGY